MKKIFFVLCSGFVLGSMGVSADVFHARNTGMGGVGVASSQYDAASLYNPALLTRQKESDSFSVIIPNVGVEASDKDEVIDTLDDLTDVFDQLESAIDLIPASPVASDFDAANAAKDRILNGLALVDEKPVRVNVGAAFSVAVPSDNIAFALDIRSTAEVSVQARFDENDEAIIDLAIATGNSDLDTVNFGSSVKAVGAVVSEVVMSFAKKFELGGKSYSFAIAPKYQSVETILYTPTVNNFDSDDFDADKYSTDESSFNVDFGAALYLNDKVTLGATVKNLVAKDYKTVTVDVNGVSENDVYEIAPSITAGIAYESGFFTTAVDVDLLPQKSFKSLDDSQFFRAGLELNAADWAQLRLGVRFDMEGTRDDVVTVGVGLSPFDVFHIGITGIAGENETYGAAVEIKFTI